MNFLEKYDPYLNLLGRLLLGGIFLLSGLNKIGGYAGTQGYMEAAGVPGALLPLVILTEALGGLAVIVGYQTRLAALALAGFSLLAAFIFHFQPDNQMQMINFMKNLGLAGAFLILVRAGAGPLSLEARKA